MSERCASEVTKALAAQRSEFSKIICILCKYGVPLHGEYHVIDEITDDPMFGPQKPKAVAPAVALKCFCIKEHKPDA